MKTDNRIISDARGECLSNTWIGHNYHRAVCFLCGETLSVDPCRSHDEPIHVLPQYDTDPAAWTPELYQFIEDKGMWFAWLDYLCIGTTAKSLDHGLGIPQITAMLKASAPQKARALSLAIKETL